MQRQTCLSYSIHLSHLHIIHSSRGAGWAAMFLSLGPILGNEVATQNKDTSEGPMCEFHSGLTRMPATERWKPGCAQSRGTAPLLVPCVTLSSLIPAPSLALGEVSAPLLNLHNAQVLPRGWHVQSMFTLCSLN